MAKGGLLKRVIEDHKVCRVDGRAASRREQVSALPGRQNIHSRSNDYECRSGPYELGGQGQKYRQQANVELANARVQGEMKAKQGLSMTMSEREGRTSKDGVV